MEFLQLFKVVLYYVYVNELAIDIQKSCKLLCGGTDKNAHHTQVKNNCHYGFYSIVSGNFNKDLTSCNLTLTK
jgi:hypothetical protein